MSLESRSKEEGAWQLWLPRNGGATVGVGGGDPETGGLGTVPFLSTISLSWVNHVGLCLCFLFFATNRSNKGNRNWIPEGQAWLVCRTLAGSKSPNLWPLSCLRLTWPVRAGPAVTALNSETRPPPLWMHPLNSEWICVRGGLYTRCDNAGAPRERGRLVLGVLALDFEQSQWCIVVTRAHLTHPVNHCVNRDQIGLAHCNLI